ncbi:MAG: hypothetical protein JWP01_1906 [Myxococcales bacterium]|nr:hypothetical protein [Myxococcales bacterium]
MRSLTTLGHTITRHPYSAAAIGVATLAAGLILPAIVPELVRYVRIRRM